ncbi:MAG: hypothetical protein Q9195_007402 [Heterodermia aff. obscurata]
MESAPLIDKIQALTDLELAILLSLVAGQHCLIETEPESLQLACQELQLIASNGFGLSTAVAHCSKSMSIQEFGNEILIQRPRNLINEEEPSFASDAPSQSKNHSSKPAVSDDSLGFPNLIILKDLNLADSEIQIQALENDHLFISHYHDSEDGFSNLEEDSEWIEDDRASLNSVIRPFATKSKHWATIFTQMDVQLLAELGKKVAVTAEIKAYLQNVVTFLRLHRAVCGGISPRATQHFDILVRSLAPLHGLDFVTPSLVSLAARKIYGHRISICAPENERSMQYGSDLTAISMLLEDMTAADVVEEFDITHGPFPAKLSHLNPGEQYEYEKAYEKRQSIHQKQVAPADDDDAAQNVGKGKTFYKTEALKELALYNNGRILYVLLQRSQERSENGLPVPPTMISAATELANDKAAKKDDKAAKKAAKDVEKAADALLKIAVGSEDDFEETEEEGEEGDDAE